MSDYVNCFACGAKSLNIKGECHEYMLASAGCWEMFNEIMAKEYSDFRYAKGHQFTVDAYACQHFGLKNDKRAVNSVNIHLASLYYAFEEGRDVSDASELRQKFSQYYKNKNVLNWLDPPEKFEGYTIYDIWDNENPKYHFDLVQTWARSVWDAWAHQHQKIEQLVNQVNS